MAETITLTLNLGSNASIAAVAAAVDDVRRVLEFASTLQRRVDRGALIAARMRSRRRGLGRPGDLAWSDGSLFFAALEPVDLPQPIDEFERIAGREADENAQITVQSLRYENPLELVILAGGSVVYALLRLLRDWPDRQQLNRAAFREYENGVIFRERVRARVLEQIDSGDLPLTPELIDSLLTDDVADALGALGDGPLKVLGLPSGSAASKPTTES